MVGAVLKRVDPAVGLRHRTMDTYVQATAAVVATSLVRPSPNWAMWGRHNDET